MVMGKNIGYELREGLVPANYRMRGSAGGLARIDAIFGGHGYDKTFSGAPVPFGAFPSLHAGCSTMEALFLSHFFPKGRPFYWLYVFLLYWSTMVCVSLLRVARYLLSFAPARARAFEVNTNTTWVLQYLTHHYLIDLVAGGSLSCTFFYYYLSKMPDELRHPTARPLPPYRARATSTSTAQQQFGDNSIPLDEESGLPKPFAHHAATRGLTNGHGNGYGGWEAEEEDEEDGGGAKSGVESLADEARMYVPAAEVSGNGLQRTKSPLRRD